MSAGGSSPKRLLGLLAGGLLIAYAALAHYISTLPTASHWGALIAIAPMLAMAFDLARRLVAVPVLVLLAALAVAAMFLAWPYLTENISWVYFLQHVAINLTLALVFGRTLLPGRQALCTFFATFVHTTMSPAVVRYTRQVTAAWSAFFICVAIVSVVLFFLAPLEAWSVFANLLAVPLVILMFLAEHLVRRAVLPPEDQLGPTSAFRAYQAARRARQSPLQPDKP